MDKEIIIRKATSLDAEGKGYVHYHSWNQTYTGLIDQDYLDSRSLEGCIETAKKFPNNTFVAVDNKKIVGFASYIKARDEDINNAGEVIAIYLLKEYKGLGLGKKLMNECLKELMEFNKVIVWVLSSNLSTISFYEHLGFIKDGSKKELKINEKSSLEVIRMIFYK
ncbi:hypothetical protein CI105_04740 [Candidatus Izimaplasma bacterium ZiA1]|uniref:GNAT family N-acetyltransferase n=1 Tax=Candidatus Izimoplasma sp. ZiA1 TaxID=2024899 RepID=UPI000BAA8278|nr:hypothetical protein CI105_04740 [Candidatus Izimaplasma bacterium ZiA1]